MPLLLRREENVWCYEEWLPDILRCLRWRRRHANRAFGHVGHVVTSNCEAGDSWSHIVGHHAAYWLTRLSSLANTKIAVVWSLHYYARYSMATDIIETSRCRINER